MAPQDAPLLVNPWPSWHKYSWMAEFVRQIPNAQVNTIHASNGHPNPNTQP